ncbi:hypothetical protein [Bacteroides ovatus]|uniref:hypothetical protein n=1 Tax=Bacteroides ovatus TaxID=28116 RepID=UPI001F33C95A|nr:hypothetical protein [Bacteroides ovatus]MCE8922606.1 hypothetical protein [Bacteroides ovatus]
MKQILLLVLSIIISTACTPNKEQKLLILDMVHHNPGEEFTISKFNQPDTLDLYGFNGQVINEFQSVHCAITYDSLSSDIFPKGSEERAWVENLADRIDHKINEIHAAGLKAYYFMDIIVLPKKVKELYHDEICDSDGWINLNRPKTQEIHRKMLQEVFARFPSLDGLVIRVGETYLHNVPYHCGNGPIRKKNGEWKHDNSKKSDGGENTHSLLINLLRDEVCEKLQKDIIYRTWDFGFFHTNPDYYLQATNQVLPHEHLYFAIKHVEGDYHRTIPFNSVLGIGKHKQIVEVQCQREYEGKGAYPNYIANGVIEGFEEYKKTIGMHSLKKLSSSPLFAGVWTWSRGGGWVGPYIKNELWCDLNTYVLSNWAKDYTQTEEQIFNNFAVKIGIRKEDIGKFRRLALLSADAVVRGRASLIYPANVWWTRDEFIGGLNELRDDFKYLQEHNMASAALNEKKQSVAIWKEMLELSHSIQCNDKQIKNYIEVSTEYGYCLYSIYALGWEILWYGFTGDQQGTYDTDQMKKAIKSYDAMWERYQSLHEYNPQCGTLYRPYSFVNEGPDYHGEDGMAKWINHYRQKVL